MIKKLRKVGNSNALILDKPILELLGLEEEGQVKLTIADGSLIITPTEPGSIDDDRFEASLERLIEERRDLFRRLAE